ncbi:MAG: hypothetical protein ACM3XM_12845, partial [Mycobacterium leprae]
MRLLLRSMQYGHFGRLHHSYGTFSDHSTSDIPGEGRGVITRRQTMDERTLRTLEFAKIKELLAAR